MIISMSTVSHRGTKLLRLCKMAAIKLWMDKEECANEQAIQLWFNRIAAYKCTGRVSPDNARFFWPTEAFVSTFDQQTKRDQVEMGNREIGLSYLLFLIVAVIAIWHLALAGYQKPR